MTSMKLKLAFLSHCILFVLIANANMASPIRPGTKTSTAFSSKDIDILSETINIKIASDFKTAKFTIEYNIQSNISGNQIPLLFYAKNYGDKFSVLLDNNSVLIQDIPSDFILDASYNGLKKEADDVDITWNKDYQSSYKLQDLKYFETDIPKGKHKITVSYTANVWVDVSGWTKKYSFYYSLTPAKFWKSFGILDIRLEQAGNIRQLTTNIGLPEEKKFQQKNNWHFNKLPDEYLAFSYTPMPNKLASILISIEPFGIALLVGLLLFVIHLILIILYRKRNPNKKQSLVVGIGSILVPLLFLISYIYSFTMIDDVIGTDAGKSHGYSSILALIFYPVFLPIYWFVMWLLDKFIKRKLSK